MPNVRLEDLTSQIDGITDTFQTTFDYETGSLKIFINGQLKKREWEDGWVEMGGKKFKVPEPPLVGDTLHVFYKDTLPTVSFKIDLKGKLIEKEKLVGKLIEREILRGVLKAV